MSMDNTNTETSYVVKKADGTVAMEVIVRYYGLDYAQLMATTEAHLAALEALTNIGREQVSAGQGNVVKASK